MTVDPVIPAGYVVLITGAASGIGRATTLALAAAGARVVAVDNDQRALAGLRPAGGSFDGPFDGPGDRAEDVAACLAADGEVDRRVLDVTDDAAVRATVGDLVARYGRVDAYINCVGINPDAGTPSHEVDLDTFDLVYRINLRAAFSVTQAVLPSMLDQRFGRIAHVASIAGKEGNPAMAGYSATKAGLIGLVKALGREYATTGITVNALAPAVIRTPLVERTSSEVVEAMLARIPMGRPGELAEAAAMLTWMISPQCGFTTGFTFDLSGGRATY